MCVCVERQQPADVNSIEKWGKRNEWKKKTVSLLLLSSVIHSSILLDVVVTKTKAIPDRFCKTYF